MIEEENKKSDWSKREMGAFWTRESSKGKYLSGSIELEGKKVKVVMFPNRYKDNDKKPDYVLYLSQDTPNTGQTNQSQKNEIPDTLV